MPFAISQGQLFAHSFPFLTILACYCQDVFFLIAVARQPGKKNVSGPLLIKYLNTRFCLSCHGQDSRGGSQDFQEHLCVQEVQAQDSLSITQGCAGQGQVQELQCVCLEAA